jgi:hypothetical protein
VEALRDQFFNWRFLKSKVVLVGEDFSQKNGYFVCKSREWGINYCLQARSLCEVG